MELTDYLRVLRRGWILIVVGVLVGVGSAAAFSLFQKPTYEATNKVFISLQSANSVSELTQGGTFAQSQVKSYADIVATPLVLQPVIDELGLDLSVQKLASMISADSPANTVIVAITASSGSAVDAAKIANAVAGSFKNTVAALVPSTAADGNSVKVTVLQEATVPGAPASPRVPLNLAIGAIVGLVVGLGLAFLRHFLDNKIRGERDVSAITQAPIIGGIIYDARAAERPLVVQDDPRSPRSESFRTLRTNLRYLEVADHRKSFVITSSIPGEGKSTTAANLALVTAAAGSKVVIVDADLRKPRLAQYLGLEGGAGLTDILVGRAEPIDVIQRWGTSNLYVLPAGRIPPNPSELMGSQAMSNLIKSLEQSFDIVFFDAAPLLPVTDSAILAKHAGSALVMAAAGRTHKHQLAASIAALENVGARISGVVLTMLPVKGPDAYGQSRYGYGYGYGAADIESTMDAASETSKVNLSR